jgi:FKBP-type peptidyl-prolyl cis-trans isomerase
MKKSIGLYMFATLGLLNVAFPQGPNFQITSSGLIYTIHSDKKTAPARYGDFLKYDLIETLHDSILLSTLNNMPVYSRVDSIPKDYSPVEIFPLLRKGDTAMVAMPAADILQRTGGPLPAFLRKNDTIFLAFKVLEIFQHDNDRITDSAQEVTRLRGKEVQAIESYLALHQITAEKTPAGSYITITNPGSGPTITPGKKVTFHFTCRVLHSFGLYASNQSAPLKDSLTVAIGKGEILPAVEDGLRKLRAGGKATLYIPAFLAYDSMQGPGGGTFEDLIFDIEVDKVAAAPR